MDYLSIKKNKKGFTLAELLIVVAIIAVLTAIAIPVFTSQLKKSRLATNQANARSAVAMATTQLLDPTTTATTFTYDVATAQIYAAGTEATANGDISAWTTTTNVGIVCGDAIAKSWVVSFNSTESGGIKGISGSASAYSAG